MPCFYLHWSIFLEEVHFQADYFFFLLVRYEYKYTVSSVHFDFVLNQVIFSTPSLNEIVALALFT